MKTKELKITQIGNSRGIRIPAEILRRYHMDSSVFLEERSEGILLRPAEPIQEKLSWEETAQEMAASREDWGEWDGTLSDGLESLSWSDNKRASDFRVC
jgi:antitoxin component of MazEF toxin-antitoxin module